MKNTTIKSQDYWLQEHHLQWATEHGFDWTGIVTPTFEMFFDWAEEKWGIEIKSDHIGTSEGKMYQYRMVKDRYNITPTQYRDYFDTKREARTVLVNAIIDYVNSLPNE